MGQTFIRPESALPLTDTTQARLVLGFDPRPVRETIQDTARSLLVR